MNKRLAVAAMIVLALAFASCGGGSNNAPPPVGGGSNGGFSNASLNGTWVFTVRGSGAANDFAVLGIFNADGNGHITSGSQDLNDSSSGYSANNPVSGTYSVASDGRGQVQLNFSGGNALFRFVLTSGGKARIFEVSGVEDATGQMFKQDSTAISNLAGNYVLRLDGFLNGGIDAVVGRISASGGPASGTLSATLDENFGGTFTPQLATTGTFNMAASGKGTAALTGGATTFNLAYYIVSSSHVEFIETDIGGVLSGGADLQGSDFSTAAVNGPYVFSIAGLTNTGTQVQTIREIGRTVLNGSGAITSGAEDLNLGANFQENVNYTGTYTVQPNGRFTMQFAFSNQNVNLVGWLSSTQSAVLMTTDSDLVETGTMRLQTGSFSTATLNGNYGLAFAGPNFSTGFEVQLTGATRFDGAGGIAGTEDFQTGGTLTANSPVSGGYSIDANGHSAGTLGGIPFRLYLADSSTAYFIAADSQRGYSGILAVQ
jgi:hypothetical protein